MRTLATDRSSEYRGTLPYAWTILISLGSALLTFSLALWILTPSTGPTAIRAGIIAGAVVAVIGLGTWRYATSGSRWPQWAAWESRRRWAPRLSGLLLLLAVLLIIAVFIAEKFGSRQGFGVLQWTGIGVAVGFTIAAGIVYLSLGFTAPVYLEIEKGSFSDGPVDNLSLRRFEDQPRPRWSRSDGPVTIQALGSVVLLAHETDSYRHVHLATKCSQRCGPVFSVPADTPFAVIPLGPPDIPDNDAVLIRAERPIESIDDPPGALREVSAARRNRLFGGILEAGRADRWGRRTRVHRVPG